MIKKAFILHKYFQHNLFLCPFASPNASQLIIIDKVVYNEKCNDNGSAEGREEEKKNNLCESAWDVPLIKADTICRTVEVKWIFCQPASCLYIIIYK